MAFHRTRIGRRSSSLPLATIGALAGVTLFVGAAYLDVQAQDEPTPIVDDTGKPIPQFGDPAERVLVVVVDNTTSGRDRREVLDQQLAHVAAAASAVGADVEVVALDDATDTSVQELARASFAGRCGGTDNPECPVDVGITNTFITEVHQNLSELEPTEATDIVGVLVHLDRRRAELATANPDAVLGAVLISDGISTTPGCDFNFVPLNPVSFPETAQTCLAGLGIDLGGLTVHLAGVGQTDSDANPDVLRATPDLVGALVSEAGGVPRLINLEAGSAGLWP